MSSSFEPKSGATATVPGADPLRLTVDTLSKSFGGLTAVDIEHLDLAGSGVTALIGPNGAGKTTAFDLISGFITPSSGTVTFGGKDITHWSPEHRARQGLVRTFQLTRVFDRLTVVDNMLIGAMPSGHMRLVDSMFRRSSTRAAVRANREKAMELLRSVRMGHMADALGRELSGGQKKLLEYSRALMGDPKVLLLDEPLAGVTPPVREEMIEHIRAFVDGGGAIVLVEHDLPRVMRVADHVVVLERGKVLAQGSPELVTSDERVLQAYLGSAHRD